MARNGKKPRMFGLGLYSFRDVAEYTGISRQRINRILYGHKSKLNGKALERSGLWKPELGWDDPKTVSFRDMMELRAVDCFLDTGKGFDKVDKAYSLIRKDLGEKYPLTSPRMKVEGAKILLKEGVREVLSIAASGPGGPKGAIDRFFRDIEFKDSVPVRWWIGGKDKGIVLDPKIKFGMPREAECGVPTLALYESAKATGDITKTARYFEVDPACVNRAFEFESRLSQ